MTGLVEVGSYSRELRAGLDRLIENALDWEHLPHLHAGSFSAVRVLDHGPEGWRAEARMADGAAISLVLRLDGAGWTTRSYSGGWLTSEIRSRAEATGPESCRVDVTFLVADPPEDRETAIGIRYQRLYQQLYDEDERMMIARAEAIRRGPAALKETRPVVLAEGSEHRAPVYCPHQGLPLDAEPDADGIITCPWHGYRIDTRTGRCTPPQAASASTLRE